LKDSARFLLLLVDSEQKRFRVGASSEGGGEAANHAESLVGSKDFINWLYAEAKPLNIPDVHEDSRLRALRAPWMMKSLIFIPMLIRTEVIGMILIYDMVPNAFDKQDFDNFLVLGNQIVIGVEKATLYEKVQYLSITDGLTGLTVHRYLQERLDEEIRRAVRYSQPLAFVMMDIDFFKKYNDMYGHLAGDEVLKCVARILSKAAEGAGIVSRYGGEEFALVLPDQSKEAASRKAEQIRKLVEAEKLTFEGQTTTVTISCGVAGFPEDAMTKKGLIDRADQALYQAKASGRNKVCQA
jgi:diguanylate cyclase (GGDEF)-like protein